MKIKFLLIVIIISFNSCIGLRIKGKKSNKTYYEEFFIAQGVMQYFVKPLEYKSEKNNLSIDFTFRDTLSYNSFVIVNYSVFTDEAIKKIDSTFFVFNTEKIELKHCEKLFIDKKKKYQIRNSCKITYRELMQIIESDFEIWTYYNNQNHIFSPTRQAKTGVEITKTRIIDIIELNRD